MAERTVPPGHTLIYTKYITTRSGKRIFHPRGGVFVFPVPNSRIRRGH